MCFPNCVVFFHEVEFLNNDILFTIFCLTWKKFIQAYKKFINTVIVCTFTYRLCKECQHSPKPAKTYAPIPYSAYLQRNIESGMVQATVFQSVLPYCRERPRLRGQSYPSNQYSKHLRPSHTVFINIEGTEDTFRYSKRFSFSREMEFILLSETF